MTSQEIQDVNVKGYASPRAFSGFQIPIPLQSMAIRRYCEDRDFVFNHHVVENITPDSYLVLERVAREASQYQAIAMCSIGLLPKEKSHRNEIMAACIRAGTSLHFVFEQIVINDLKQVQELSEFLNLMVVSGKQLDLITDLNHLLSREI